jgi:hypothetical protein
VSKVFHDGKGNFFHGHDTGDVVHNGRRQERITGPHPDRASYGSAARIGPFKPHDVLPHGVADLVRLGTAPLHALAAVPSAAARACAMSAGRARSASVPIPSQ